MIEELHKKGCLTDQNYLNEKGQVLFKEKIAGKTSSPELSRLTGYTDVYVRLLIGGFRPINKRNVVVLETIERIADGFAEIYAE